MKFYFFDEGYQSAADTKTDGHRIIPSSGLCLINSSKFIFAVGKSGSKASFFPA